MNESKVCDDNSPVLFANGIRTGYAVLDLGVLVVNPELRAGELLEIISQLIKKNVA